MSDVDKLKSTFPELKKNRKFEEEAEESVFFYQQDFPCWRDYICSRCNTGYLHRGRG